MLMSRSVGLMAVVLLAACRNLEAPAPSQETRLVVHGALSPVSVVQTILVYRARTGLPNTVGRTGEGDDEPVADAQVTMTAPDGTTYAAYAAGRPAEPSGDCC